MIVSVAMLVAQASLPPETSAGEEPARIEIELTGRQMLEAASQAFLNGKEETAIEILELLVGDREMAVRNEARFRLAMIAMRSKRWQKAGQYLRDLLDEEPGAQRARLELARVQAELGDMEASRRTLREAQAGGLPSEIALLVERFSAALRSRKPVGLNVQLAIAPDSNINRATRSTTLGTVFGDFLLDEDARESSGVGAKIVVEGHARKALSSDVSLVVRGGFSGDFYRKGRFNDMTVLASAGPEFGALGGQATLLFGAQQRWFGNSRYQNTLDANVQWLKPLGRLAQMRLGLGYSRLDYRANDLQDGDAFNGFASYERALGKGAGVGVTIGADRQVAADPAYSSTGAQIGLTGWRELGATTLFATLTYSRFEADARLTIYPERRKDDTLRASFGATFRAAAWKGWAPQVKLVHERNWSPIEVYRFDRWRGEFGIVRSF